MKINSMNQLKRTVTIVLCSILALCFVAVSAFADETATTNIPSPSYPRVGGHLGFAVPIVSFGNSSGALGTGQSGGSTQTIGSNFIKVGLSTGITIKLDDFWAVDFETVAYNNFKSNGSTDFVVDPGVIYNTGPCVVGLRTAVDTAPGQNWGIIPIIVKAFGTGTAKFFVEMDFPVFIRPTATTFGLQPQFGMAF